MAVRGQDIASVIKRQIQEFGGDVTMVDVGTVVEAGLVVQLYGRKVAEVQVMSLHLHPINQTIMIHHHLIIYLLLI